MQHLLIRRWSIVAGLLLVGLLIAAACSGGESKEASGSDPAVSPPELLAGTTSDIIGAGTGSFCWPGDDAEVCSDPEGVVTGLGTLVVTPRGIVQFEADLPLSELNNFEASAWPLPQVEQISADDDTQAWAVSGEGRSVPVGTTQDDGPTRLLMLVDLPGGEHVVEVRLEFDEGSVSYGLLVKVAGAAAGFGFPFPLSLGDSLVVGGSHQVTFSAVADDSRCARGVECVTAGVATLVVSVSNLDREVEGLPLEISPDGQDTAHTDEVQVTILDLRPAANADGAIDESAYEITVRVDLVTVPTVERVEALAPIEALTINIAESLPVQYFAEVRSGLPNGCAAFDRIEQERDGATIRLTVSNLVVAPGQDVVCTAVYGIATNTVALGDDFEPGAQYTVIVNDEVTETFVAQ